MVFIYQRINWHEGIQVTLAWSFLKFLFDGLNSQSVLCLCSQFTLRGQMLASLWRVVCGGRVAKVQFCNDSVFVTLLVDIEKLLTLTRLAMWAGEVRVSYCPVSMERMDTQWDWSATFVCAVWQSCALNGKAGSSVSHKHLWDFVNHIIAL